MAGCGVGCLRFARPEDIKSKIAELEVTQWSAADLLGEDPQLSGFCPHPAWQRVAAHEETQDVDEGAERRLPEFTTATQAEKFKEQEKSASRHQFARRRSKIGASRLNLSRISNNFSRHAEVSSLREWIYAKKVQLPPFSSAPAGLRKRTVAPGRKEEQLENFQPSGPSWSLAGQAMAVPRLPGGDLKIVVPGILSKIFTRLTSRTELQKNPCNEAWNMRPTSCNSVGKCRISQVPMLRVRRSTRNSRN